MPYDTLYNHRVHLRKLPGHGRVTCLYVCTLPIMLNESETRSLRCKLIRFGTRGRTITYTLRRLPSSNEVQVIVTTWVPIAFVDPTNERSRHLIIRDAQRRYWNTTLRAGIAKSLEQYALSLFQCSLRMMHID